MKSLELEQIEINDKPVYIFEDHSLAFKAWHKIKQNLRDTPYVISLDHHTDTRRALNHFSFYNWVNTHNNHSPQDGYYERVLKTYLYSLDTNNEEQIDSLLLKLKHDEHIDAAIKLGIISHSISIQWSEFSGTSSIEEGLWHLNDWKNYIGKVSSSELQELMNNRSPYPEPPYNYNLPENKMFIIGYPKCKCPKSPHDEICHKNMYDNALESSFLAKQLEIVNNLQDNLNRSGLQTSGFILDIDLDYFHTINSVSPSDRENFSWLVKNSLAISIAKESICVDMLKCEGENIDSNYLLKKLLVLIAEC